VREVVHHSEMSRSVPETGEDLENLIGRLLVAALAGYDDARTSLAKMRPPSGHNAEVWLDAISV